MKHKMMSSLLFRLVSIVLVIGMLTMGMASSVVGAEDPVVAAGGSPTITTDKTKYSLGETMVISGIGFTADGTVNIQVLRPDHEIDTLGPVSTDADGAFQTTYSPPNVPGRYKITATDGIDTAKTAATEADAANYSLVAFGVKTNAAGTLVTDIGWGRGNSDKGWREGDWVPVKLTIVGANLATLPDIYIGWDYTTGPDDARFVDLVRDLQVGTPSSTDGGGYPLGDEYGWPKADGTPYPTGPSPLPLLAAVHTAQTSTGQNTWTGFTSLQGVSLVNYPGGATDSSLGTRPGTVTDKKHQFKIPGNEIRNVLGATGTADICIYFQAHLARTFVWTNALEKQYNISPYTPWGGDLYGASVYNTDTRVGSSYAPGSSGQMYVLMTGQGQITCQLPIPPKPAGLIDGYKFNDADNSGTNMTGNETGIQGWRIYISGIDPEGLVFSKSVLTDGNGFYSFTGLTDGTWYVAEDEARASPVETFWSQTYPNGGTPLVPPVATPILSGSIPLNFPGSPDLGPWGYSVALNEVTSQIQHHVDFGNVGTGCLTVHKTATIPACVVGTPPNVDFTVHVVGPSYPSGIDLVFHLVNGVITNNDQTLPNITPGQYTVSEPTQPASWNLTSIAPTQPINIAGGSSCGGNVVTVTDTFQPGCLTVHKTATIPACVVGTPPNVDFTVKIVGPSYPGPTGTTLTFHLVNGVITNNDQTLTCILPGAYTVSEPTQPASWNLTSILPAQPINIAAGSSCGANVVTVTDTFQPGCLTVHKTATIPACVVGTPPDVDFTVEIVGPSYPGPTGTTMTFHLVNGVITNNDQTLTCILPGAYTVSEPTQPASWNLTSILPVQPINIAAGSSCGANVVNVTDTYQTTCLTVHKTATIPACVVGTPPDVDFTVKIVGPSYPGPTGTTLTFHLVNGVITNNDQTLTCILPGAYTVSEPTQPASWNLTSITPTQPINIAAGSSCGANVVTVTDTFQPGCLTIYKSLVTTGYLFASNITMDFIVKVVGPSYPGPAGHNVTFHVVNGAVTNSPQTLSCILPGAYNVSEVNPGIMWTVTGGGNVNVSSGITCAQSTVTNTIKLPHTTINITADVYETTAGGNVWLYISDKNDGQVPLTDPHIHLLIGGVEFDANNVTPGIQPLTKGDAYWSSGPLNWPQIPGAPNGDTINDGIMGVNETWYWAVQVTISATTEFIVNGHGIDPLGYPVDGPTYSTETDTITVEVGGATRTWGFWKTHLFLVNWMFNPAGGNITLPIYMGTWKNYSGTLQAQNITNVCRYMGLMWSDQAKNSDRTQRKDIDKARIHTAYQALAAIMNDSMTGGADLLGWLKTHGYPSATDARATIADILTNGTIEQIRNLGSKLGDFNESGDDVALDPSLPATGRTTGNIADPQGGRTAGATCISFWNTPRRV